MYSSILILASCSVLIEIMVIHFLATTRNIKTKIDTYRKIVSVIHHKGHRVSSDWVEHIYNEVIHNVARHESWEETCQIELDAAERADLIIVESSLKGGSFGLGYETCLALQKKKPVLLLLGKGQSEGIFLSGLQHSLLTRKEYTEDNLEKIVESFIQENTINTKDLRFNFVIDRQIHNHLNHKARKLGKTKAEVVRDLVLAHMKRSEQL